MRCDWKSERCTRVVSSKPKRAARTAGPRHLGHLETEQLSLSRSGKDSRGCGRSADSKALCEIGYGGGAADEEYVQEAHDVIGNVCLCIVCGWLSLASIGPVSAWRVRTECMCCMRIPSGHRFSLKFVQCTIPTRFLVQKQLQNGTIVQSYF